MNEFLSSFGLTASQWVGLIAGAIVGVIGLDYEKRINQVQDITIKGFVKFVLITIINFFIGLFVGLYGTPWIVDKTFLEPKPYIYTFVAAVGKIILPIILMTFRSKMKKSPIPFMIDLLKFMQAYKDQKSTDGTNEKDVVQ